MNKENQEISIRRLTVTDADSYRSLRLRAVEEHPEAFIPYVEEESQRTPQEIADRFEKVWNKANNFILGAFNGSELIGMAGFYQYERQKLQHKGGVWGVYVRNELQGRGIGKLLIQSLVNEVRKLEAVKQIMLSVSANNNGAKRLYDSFGFQVYGTEPRAVCVYGKYIDEEHRVLILQ